MGTSPRYQLEPQEWINRYADLLYSYTLARVKPAETAQDIVQDTFYSAFRAKEQFNGEASEQTWLFAICRNKIIDHFRKLNRSLEILQAEHSIFFDEADHWKQEQYPQNWPRASDAALYGKEFMEVLHRCRKKLQEIQEAVFVLKYLEDMSSEEICKALAISPSNYWVLMHRAKLNLRRCIEKNGWK